MIDNLIDTFHCIFTQFHIAFLPFLSFRVGPCPNLTAAAGLKVIHQIGGALDACIGQLTYFLAIVAIPSSSVEFLMKLLDEFGVDEVGEGVSYVAGVVVIDG